MWHLDLINTKRFAPIVCRNNALDVSAIVIVVYRATGRAKKVGLQHGIGVYFPIFDVAF